jgi:hypothetical protein
MKLTYVFCSVSSTQVGSFGPFKYVLKNQDPNETRFPLECHGNLAGGQQNSPDTPAALIWSSNLAEPATTISQTQSSIVVTATVSSTPLSSSSSISSAISTSSTAAAGSVITTPPQPTAPASTSSGGNNTGAIAGGTTGAIALLSFITLALVFLRKYKRSHASPFVAAMPPEYSKQGVRPSQEWRMQEMEGSGAAYRIPIHEMENRIPVHEMPGNNAWQK